MSTLEEYLAERVAAVNRALEGCLPAADTFPASVHRAMRYSLFAGGKRLRPVLLLAAAEAAGGDWRPCLPAACAVELLHTYSLIHDDLPAMDNDDFRRGKPTCHRAFGEAVAILAGDALLTHCFYLLAGMEGIPAGTVLSAIRELAAAAGSTGLIGGQVVDLESEGRPVSQETLHYIHAHKTGALFVASARMGALLVGADAPWLAAVTAYAAHFGLAFQIVDDILDVTGDTAAMGKTAGSDLRQAKATYPGLLGLAEARRRAEEETRLAVKSLTPLGGRGWALRELAESLLQRDR